MTVRLCRRALLPAVLLGVLVVLDVAQETAAGLRIFWRSAVLSWDSPATELRDRAATEAGAHADPARQAREQLAGLPATGRLSLASRPDPAAGVPAASPLTRAPPRP